MLPSRRVATVIFGVVVATGLAGCGGSGSDAAETGGEATLAGPLDVPFGLDDIEGIEPLGRPAVFDHEYLLRAGEPVMARSVRAVYRVTGADPPAVLHDVLAGLEGLALDEGAIQGTGDPSCLDCSGAPGLWLEASARQESSDGLGDRAHLQLWATDDGPVVVVDVSRLAGDPAPPRTPTIAEEGTVAGSSSPAAVESTAGSAGDVLFTEQGDDIHLPTGTRALLPTLPTSCGTGGSTSVIAADDGEAAVRAMLDEAQERSEYGEVDGPDVTEIDGVEVVEAGFVIPAGGWGFDLLAVRGPDDPYATVYVTSCAD